MSTIKEIINKYYIDPKKLYTIDKIYNYEGDNLHDKMLELLNMIGDNLTEPLLHNYKIDSEERIIIIKNNKEDNIITELIFEIYKNLNNLVLEKIKNITLEFIIWESIITQFGKHNHIKKLDEKKTKLTLKFKSMFSIMENEKNEYKNILKK